MASWQLPAPRSREVALPVGSGLVVAGGLSSAQVSTAAVWRLDPSTGRVQARGRLAEPVHDATGAAVGGRSYVIAGGNTSTVGDVQQLRPGMAARVVGSLPRPRSDLVSAVDGDAVYVLGGFDGVTALPQVLRTTDGRRFATVARLRVTVRYPAVAALGDRLLVFGGEHNGAVVDDVQEVDLRSGDTRVVGRLPRPLAHESAFVLDGVVWLVGGRSGEVLQSRIWRWDDRRRRAVAGGTLPYAVADAASAVTGSTAYLLGGETPGQTARVVRLTASPG
ncbi:MAG TPA: hypothetical protein VFJ98_07745 [Mycobacteriales bacterium]|nr:hypothetical protein [Mycobacteriales bacterium]